MRDEKNESREVRKKEENKRDRKGQRRKEGRRGKRREGGKKTREREENIYLQQCIFPFTYPPRRPLPLPPHENLLEIPTRGRAESLFITYS